ncbi:MAG: hypothetical protein ACKOPC_02720, partial [Methylocystis sp.]
GIGNICCGPRALNVDHEGRRIYPSNVVTSERLIVTIPSAITGGAAPKINKKRGEAVEARAAMPTLFASDRKG